MLNYNGVRKILWKANRQRKVDKIEKKDDFKINSNFKLMIKKMNNFLK